jgi:hypothetical protein
MALLNTTIPNLIGGVSQQSDALRYGSQAREQINGYSSAVEGLIKRPPSIHIARLFQPASGGMFMHTINRDASERYIVTIQKTGQIRIFEIDGVERTITYDPSVTLSNGHPLYLQDSSSATSNPQFYLQATSVADYTFLLNKNVITSMNTATYANRPYETIVYVAQGAYNSSYELTVTYNNVNYRVKAITGKGDGTGTGEYRTQIGSAAEATTAVTDLKNENAAKTDIIAANIRAGIAGILPAAGGFSVNVYGSSIHITSANSFVSKVSDSGSNTLFKIVQNYRLNTVQLFQDLPANAVDGFVAKISSDPEQVGDDYYVKFKADNGANGSGKWEETVSPGIPYSINNGTMPHAIIRTFSGGVPVFTFKRLTWRDRLSGDLDTNPDPSFIGSPIRNICFFKNRLGILADENVIFSEASEFFNFFRTTVAQLVDADPIDVATTAAKVSYLNFAIPYNDKLLLFSDQTQFKLTSGDILSSKTISISQTTEYENSIVCGPVASGRNIYFPFSRGLHSGIQEYFVSNENLQYSAVDITSAISKYINGDVLKIATSENEEVLALITDSFKTGIYIYKYLFQGDQKLQSAWFKFDFGPDAEVLNIEFINTDLYILIRRNGTYVNIETVYFQAGLKDSYAEFMTCLDRRVYSKDLPSGYITYNQDTNLTSIRLPYEVPETETFQVVTAYTDSTDPDFASPPAAADFKLLPGGYNLELSKGITTTQILSKYANWESSIVYTTGSIIKYNSSLYQRNATTTSYVAGTLPTNTTFWASVSIQDIINSYKPVYTSGGISYVRVIGNHLGTAPSVSGAIAGRPMWIGLPYTLYYGVSRPMIREAVGQGKQSVASGVYMMRSGTIMYDNTRYFRVEVTPSARNTYKYVFNGTALNTIDTIMPNNPLKDGAYRFPIMAKNDEVLIDIYNDTPYPCCLVSMDFEGYYQNRATRYNG